MEFGCRDAGDIGATRGGVQKNRGRARFGAPLNKRETFTMSRARERSAPMHDALRTLWLAHDGPAPPADLAAARWGDGAGRRLAPGADTALAEGRLRASLGALARLRRGRIAALAGAFGQLCETVMACRREALRAGQ
jgi:hypothetical protein